MISGGLLEYCVDGFVYLFQLLASHSEIFKYYSLDFIAEDVVSLKAKGGVKKYFNCRFQVGLFMEINLPYKYLILAT